MPFRLRFSLRAFLLATAFLAAALGVWTRRTSNQREQVRVLKGAGFEVVYDVDVFRNESASTRAQQWLVSRLGKDWAAVPKRVTVEDRCLYIDDLAALARLRWVDKANLSYSTADDDCLAVLSRMPHLAHLNLDSTLVTDEGLSRLNDCRSLRNLVLGYTLVSSSAVQEFRRQSPRCVVVVKEHQGPDAAQSRRFRHLKAERSPNAKEKADFDLSVAILGTTDGFEKFTLMSQAFPDSFPNKPAPGTPDFERWKSEYKRSPADLWYDKELENLGELGFAASIPILERFARDQGAYEDTRCQAIYSLALIADRRIIPIFIDLLDDPSDMVAREAAQRLRLSTGQDFIEEHNWYPDTQHESRRALIARWQQFWKENHDVIRPRRAANFDH